MRRFAHSVAAPRAPSPARRRCARAVVRCRRALACAGAVTAAIAAHACVAVTAAPCSDADDCADAQGCSDGFCVAAVDDGAAAVDGGDAHPDAGAPADGDAGSLDDGGASTVDGGAGTEDGGASTGDGGVSDAGAVDPGDAGPVDPGDAGAVDTDDAGPVEPGDGGAVDGGAVDGGAVDDAGDPCPTPSVDVTWVGPAATTEVGGALEVVFVVDDPTDRGVRLGLSVADPTEGAYGGPATHDVFDPGELTLTVLGQPDQVLDGDVPYVVTATVAVIGCGPTTSIDIPVVNEAYEGALFRTVSPPQGDFGGVEGADAYCAATHAGGRALFVLPGVRTPTLDWPLGASMPLFRPDGTYLTTTDASGQLPASTAAWAAMPVVGVGTPVWTGFGATSSSATENCLGWNSNNPTHTAIMGDASRTGAAVLSGGFTETCNKFKYLLCAGPSP